MNADIPIALGDLPYWRASFRPLIYEADRIGSVRECFDALESIAVRACGWRYPFVSRDRDRMHLRKNHAEALIDSGEFKEFSRLYRSGQFLYVTALREAFYGGVLKQAQQIYRWDKPRGSSAPTGGVNIVRLMRLVSVAFLNAQSLGHYLKLDEPVTISFKMHKVKGNVLVAGVERQLDEYYQAADDTIEFEKAYSVEAVRATPLPLAITAAKEVYAAFGWLSTADFVLEGIQQEALG